MVRLVAGAALLVLAVASAPARAQPQPDPAAPAPAPAAPPPAAAPGSPPASPLMPPPPGPGDSAQPGANQPYGYGQPTGAPGSGVYGGYGYAPPPGPPPPPPPPPSSCCRWSVRYNPFDLVYRRLSFEAEVAIAGPFGIEIDPTWIFASADDAVDTKGFELGGRAVFYILGKPMRGLWLKAHASYERFDAVVTNPNDPNGKLKGKGTLSSAILGALIGSSWVIGRDGGFTLSGGVGVGVATSPQTAIVAPGNPNNPNQVPPYQVDFYAKADRVRLLGSLALGVTF